MLNPYSKKTVILANGKELSESGTDITINARNGKVEAGQGALENASGEINAYNKKDLTNKIRAMVHAAAMGDMKQTFEFAEKRSQLVEAAMSDVTGQGWQVVGEVLADEILETMGRDGFLRKVLARKDLKKGETGRLTVRKKDVLGFTAVSDSGGVTSFINQFYVYPDEFYVKAHILIEDRELQQSPNDLLEDKYIDGLEQLMVKEDQVLKGLLDAAAPSYNDVEGFVSFTPAVFQTAKNQIEQWALPCSTAILAIDLLNDVLTDPEFSTYFDPVSKREVIMSGTVGAFFGVNIITDGFRYDTLRVLSPGQFYFLAPPNTLGAQTVRQDVMTAPINLYLIGKPSRGWYMHKIEGQSIVNGRAVVAGNRL